MPVEKCNLRYKSTQVKCDNYPQVHTEHVICHINMRFHFIWIYKHFISL